MNARSIRLVALGLGLFVFAGSGWAQQALSLPENLKSVVQDIVGGQITAFKDRDHERAFGYAAPSIRQMFGTTDRLLKWCDQATERFTARKSGVLAAAK